jgi:hypothetical protein
MAYLAEPTSTTNFGVVKIGDYINVLDGVISNPQDLSETASPVFQSLDVTDNITSQGLDVVLEVIPSAGDGISVQNLIPQGNTVSFDIFNTGVLSLIAGDGINISSATGNITISSFGADLINVYGTTTNYTATIDDEYIGVNSATAVTITLPAGVNGRVYIIKDEYGQGSGKITIQPQAGELIDKKPNYVISIPNQSVSLVFRAGSWYII